MKQEKLSFSQPASQGKLSFAHLESLGHSVFICREDSRILFMNRFARSAFPLIRPGMVFSRFCDLPLSDNALFIRPMLGQNRYFLCRYVKNACFEIHVPSSVVISPDKMPGYGSQIRALLDNVRLAAERLAQSPLAGAPNPRWTPSLTELGERLNRCLSDLEQDSDGIDPRRTVSLFHLLEAVRRRTAEDLAGTDALLSFECPENLLCSARLGPTVFILLNLICFFRICAGVRRITLKVREEDDRVLLTLKSPTLLSPSPFYRSLFTPNHQQGLDQALLATPFSLAAAAAGKEGYSLDCLYSREGLLVSLRLPLVRGEPDLIVRDPERFLSPRETAELSALTRGLFSFFLSE